METEGAIVIGGSIAGLLAARVLRDYYASVKSVLILQMHDCFGKPKHRRKFNAGGMGTACKLKQ